MTYLLILLAVSLAVSSIGWKYFIYFFSVGYGFSIALLAVTIAILFSHSLSLPTAIMLCTMFIYGCRLGGYLLKREKNSAAYRKILYAPSLKPKKPFAIMMFVWLFCAFLYVGQVSPVAFRLGNISEGILCNNLWAWVGAILMILGTLLETIADRQKTVAKKTAPNKFVSTGLYRIVRCPNYLGEIVLWSGAFISGIGAGYTAWQWLIASIGYAGIMYVMFSGARRLELRQNEVYGSDPEYQSYVKRVPILIPLIPLYSVVKYKWLQA